MTQYLNNQLLFKSNSKTILAYLKSKASGETGQKVMSLNSIKQLPPDLQLPVKPFIKELSAMNITLPDFDDRIKQIALEQISFGQAAPKSEAELHAAVASFQSSLASEDLVILEQAVTNYRQYGFFSSYDWCMTHWGTPDDIVSVNQSTFVAGTDTLAFQTVLTPPLVALKLLADTFPSVRFYLRYRYDESDAWTRTEIFPVTPFGY